MSSRLSLDLKPALLEPDELADSHGFVRIRDRSRGDWTEGESNGGGIEEGTGAAAVVAVTGAARLLLDESAENDSVRRWYLSCCAYTCACTWGDCCFVPSFPSRSLICSIDNANGYPYYCRAALQVEQRKNVAS